MAGGLLASPSTFSYNLNITRTASGQFMLENIGNTDMNVTLEDKRLLMDGIHLEFADDGIAEWITINTPTNFILRPGERKTVSFTINAPQQFRYNDAFGAITAKGVPVVVGDRPQFGVQLVITIVAGIPGPIIESLELLEHSAPSVLLSFMPGDFMYRVRNNGTVFANMTGNIEIDGLIADQKIPISGGVFPEDDHYLKAQWTPGFAEFGIYNARAVINYGRYGQDETLVVENTILVIPAWLIVLLVLALAIWIIREKGIESPVKIKFEMKK
ncbi:MAG: hypothetical protein PQ971_04900 [Methanobacterium sp.]